MTPDVLSPENPPGQVDLNKIENMFSEISPNYDLLNSVMSLGRHGFWRDCLSRRLLIKNPPGHFLDLATGTGDQLLSIKKFHPKSLLFGLDLAQSMLDLAKEKLQNAINNSAILEPMPTLILGDAIKPKLPAQSFDSITVSFGLRNVKAKKALYESVLNLLVPGARFLVLEVFFDPRSLLAPAHRWYLKKAIPFMAGQLFQSSTEAYEYLADSVLQFPHPERVIDDLLEAGFVRCDYQTYTFGVAAVIWGHKPL
ncbi:MAG: ubiquinone/menaquinone biosynthesis methyltransferase [Deltaproteobacteria bacterium]|jgi:demethylmenaquinone methyltransferase/2-methoxy-6-polyprenyl-1,4-benzoquinol methylase|nr:ubiquinone/menaquinone biosynthesis methyltransferase [Deltaproteobacteria bacterium]